MEKFNLVIIPTRSRPENAERAVKSIQEHSYISDICLGLDTDDEHNYPRLDGVIYEVSERAYMIATLNKIATKYANKYLFITFLGDDNIIKTPAWDVALTTKIAEKGYGIAYGNDLIHGEKLPTSVMMTTNIIRSLGYMVPPTLTHLYADNFWRALGFEIGALFYYPNVIWEHLHFINGKAPKDELYAEINSDAMYTKDRIAFENYVQKKLKKDVKKLKKALNVKL